MTPTVISSFANQLSLSNRVWRYHAPNDDQLASVMERHATTPRVAKIITQRTDVNADINHDDIENFLNPRLKNLLPNPFFLKDMTAGVDVIYDALLKGETIGVFGDYDVDGATSTALLHRYFTALHGACFVYIPDRVSEGYGPNTAALQKLYDQGIRRVIIVDCGTLSFEPLAYAHKIGLEIVVIDHHLSAKTLPTAVAIINPNRQDEGDNPD